MSVERKSSLSLSLAESKEGVNNDEDVSSSPLCNFAKLGQDEPTFPLCVKLHFGFQQQVIVRVSPSDTVSMFLDALSKFADASAYLGGGPPGFLQLSKRDYFLNAFLFHFDPLETKKEEVVEPQWFDEESVRVWWDEYNQSAYGPLANKAIANQLALRNNLVIRRVPRPSAAVLETKDASVNASSVLGVEGCFLSTGAHAVHSSLEAWGLRPYDTVVVDMVNNTASHAMKWLNEPFLVDLQERMRSPRMVYPETSPACVPVHPKLKQLRDVINPRITVGELTRAYKQSDAADMTQWINRILIHRRLNNIACTYNRIDLL